ncbi:MAG: metalloregulator ArsR/SmtB family transcription factor [Bacteroidota bacterium]
MRRDVFQAIADPTRRDIIRVIAGKSLPLNAVADSFGISRQAVSSHIKILAECGLVIIRKIGRERHGEVKLGPLAEVSVWLEQYRKFYEQKLDSFEQYPAVLPSKTKKNGKQKRSR